MSKTLPFGLVWLLPGRQRFLASHQTGPYLGKSGGRNWVRTSDLSLVRRIFPAAGRRLVLPEGPANWTYLLWMSPCVAWCLPPLAPRLAPGFWLASLMDGVSSGFRSRQRN